MVSPCAASSFVNCNCNPCVTLGGNAVAFCSVHAQSAEAFFAESQRRDTLMLGGKVMMDRNAPQGLRDTPQRGYDETKALIGKWHGCGRQLYAIGSRLPAIRNPRVFAQRHVDQFMHGAAVRRGDGAAARRGHRAVRSPRLKKGSGFRPHVQEGADS